MLLCVVNLGRYALNDREKERMSQMEKTENNMAKLTVTVSAEDFQKATAAAYHKNVKTYNIPGFRKGKAPRKVIENLYGEGVFYEDAFELCWGDAYDAALTEHALEAVDQPKLDIVNISEQEGFTFTAEVQLKPEVSLGQYKGIAVPPAEYTVTDAEVDAALEQEREKQARFVETERNVVENGDRIALDYSGSVDGVKFDGGTAEGQTLVIGSGSFIPGFEEQLIGKTVGEACDVTVTFPTEYHADELAGKDAVFACTVKGIEEKQMPEADDEFVKDISEHDSVAEWKASKRTELEEQKRKSAENARENAIMETVCNNATVDVPDCMVDQQADYMLRDLAYRLRASGLSLEDYCRYMGADANALKESYRADALTQVKMQLVVEAVAKAEAFTVTPEDVDAEIDKLAARGERSREETEAMLTSANRERMEDNIVFAKAIALITESAVDAKA